MSLVGVPPQRQRLGYQRVVAYTLSRPWPTAVVSRLLLAAAMPPETPLGERRASGTARLNMQSYLRSLDRDGLIQRGRVLVRVLDAARLRERAFAGLPFEAGPGAFIDVPRTVAIIRERIGFEPNPALRRILATEADLLETLSDSGRFEHLYFSAPAITGRDQPLSAAPK
jgi:hypothetical protein